MSSQDPEATVAVKRPGAVEDGDGADVRWPAKILPEEWLKVLCAQAFP
jgi:hypothetical protein